MILVFLISACVAESDGTIMHNNNKYFPRENSGTIFIFNGPSHYVKNVRGVLGGHVVYCLDVDFNENILFVYNDYENISFNEINSWFWVKNKELLPNDDTFIQSFQIVNIHSWREKNNKLSFKDISFNNVFKEVDVPNSIIELDFIRVVFSYDNIDCYDYICKDDNGDIYVVRSIWENDDEYVYGKLCYYKLLKEYNSEFNDALTTILSTSKE